MRSDVGRHDLHQLLDAIDSIDDFLVELPAAVRAYVELVRTQGAPSEATAASKLDISEEATAELAETAARFAARHLGLEPPAAPPGVPVDLHPSWTMRLLNGATHRVAFTKDRTPEALIGSLVDWIDEKPGSWRLQIQHHRGPIDQVLSTLDLARHNWLLVPTRSEWLALVGGGGLGFHQHVMVELEIHPLERGRAAASFRYFDRSIRVVLGEDEDKGTWRWSYEEKGTPLSWEPTRPTRGAAHARFHPGLALEMCRALGIEPTRPGFFLSEATHLAARWLDNGTSWNYWELPVGPFSLEQWDDGTVGSDQRQLDFLASIVARLMDHETERRCLLRGDEIASVRPAGTLPPAIQRAAAALRSHFGGDVVSPSDAWIAIDDHRAALLTLDELIAAVQVARRRRSS